MQTILSDSDCQQAAEDVSDLSVHDIKFLVRLAEYLRLRAQDAASRGDYDDATASSGKRAIVLSEVRTRRGPPPSREEAQEYSKMIRERQDQWTRQLADFDEETQRHIDEIQQKHAEELQEFDDHWENVEQDKYRKPSAALIRQRILEADMIHRDQIERAKFIHEGVKLMEERELAEAQHQYEEDYKKARAVKIAAQKDSIGRFMWQREAERMVLIKDIEKEERVLSNRLNVLAEKPPALESFRTRKIEEAATRPLVPLESSCNPGAKLPRLMFKGAERTRASTRNSRRQSSARSRTLKSTSNIEESTEGAPEEGDASS
jgi:hypothetical protein